MPVKRDMLQIDCATNPLNALNLAQYRPSCVRRDSWLGITETLGAFPILRSMPVVENGDVYCERPPF